MALLAMLIVSWPGQATADADLRLAILRYDSVGWNPRPDALKRLAWEVRRRTSVEVKLDPVVIPIESPTIFRYPMLVMNGDRAFGPLSHTAVRNLEKHLSNGGLLWIDNNEGDANGGFDTSVRRLLGRLLPGVALGTISSDHVLLKSFYLVTRFAGRVLVRPYVEGLMLGDRVAVVYTSNDMAGAYAQDQFGNWSYRVDGGERQREMAFRFGINVVLYALCLDYKTDQVHIPFILKRRR